MTGNEINFIRDGDRKDLTQFQLEKAVYFFHVNLDIEQKGYIQWEDAEFYLLFHLTTAGKENDADLEKELTSATRNVWDTILNVWPNTDHNRMQKNQFLDIWAGLSKYVQETGNIPTLIENWFLLGFKLYDLDNTGEIPPQSFQRLYSRMGLQISQALIAYRMLTNNITGGLDFHNVLTIIKSAITSNDPAHFSSYLIPGFNAQKKSGIRISTDSQGSFSMKEESEKEEPKSSFKERQESPIRNKENEKPTAARSSPNPKTKVYDQKREPSFHPMPTRMAPAAKENIPSMQNRNVSFNDEMDANPNRQFPKRNVRYDEGVMNYPMYNKEAPDRASRQRVRPLTEESRLQENMRKSDVEFIYNVLKDMNIDPNDCEILVSDSFPKDQQYGMKDMTNQRNIRSAQDMPYPDVKEQKYTSNEYQSKTLPHMKNQPRIELAQTSPMKSFSTSSLHDKMNYPMNVSNQNVSQITQPQTKFPATSYPVPDTKAEQIPAYMKTTSIEAGLDKNKSERRESLVEDILRRITPTVVKIVKDEIRKAKLSTEQQAKQTASNYNANQGPARARMPKGFERFPNPNFQKQHMEQRPQYGYDYPPNYYRPQGYNIPPAGQYGATTLPRMGPRPPPAAANVPRPSFPGMWQRTPRPTKTKTGADETKAEDLFFWQGPSGQSPSINKMVFDKLLKEKKSRTEKEETEKANDTDQNESKRSSENKENKTEVSGRDQQLSEDLDSDANFMFFQTPFAPPPFFMTMMPPMFTPGLGAMHGMGPAMDGFVIIMDQNQDNDEQKDSKAD